MLSTVRQLMSLFPRKDWWRFAGLFVLILAGAVIEAACVSMVFPVVTILASPTRALDAAFVGWFHGLLGHPAPVYFIYAVLLTLVLMYLIKNVYMAFLALMQNMFAFTCQNFISYRLFSRYMQQPYVLHLRRNTGDLLRNLTHEADRVIWSVLLPGLVLIVETSIALALVGLLFLVDVVAATIISGSFLVLGTVFYRALRDRTAIWGHWRQHHEGQRIRSIQEGLGGLKEIRVLGVMTHFLERFASHNQSRAIYSSRHILAQGLPLLFLEVLAMCGILAIVAATQLQGKPFDYVLPVLGLFVGATFRLIPAANRIITTVQELRFSASAIDLVYTEIGPWTPMEASTVEAVPFRFARDIVLDHISFRYPEADRNTLDDIFLRIPFGCSVGFVGQSGAGKTTLIDVVLGLLQPDRGSVLVDGLDIRSNLPAWQALIGYVPQSIYLADATIRENVAFGVERSRIDENLLQRALRSAQIGDFVDSLPQGLDTMIGENGMRLSGGQRQRLGIARALYRDPPVLILDEATAALDSATEGDFMRAVDSLHGTRTILIIAHRTTTLSRCDLVVRMDNGRVVATGSYAQIIQGLR